MQNLNHLCVYCGQPAKYQFKNGKWCCSEKPSSCPERRKSISLKTKQVWTKIKNQGLTKLEKKKEHIIPYICTYCGEYAEYQLKSGKWCCKPSPSQCPELRRKNSEKIKSLYSADGKIFNGKLRAEQYTEESKKKQGWAKGKTKLTDERLKARGERLSKKYKKGLLIPSQLNRHHTPEEIDKIVNGMTHFRPGKNLKGFKHGWYKGYWCDSSWELAYVIYNLEHNIKFERNVQGFDYIENGKKRRYYPDFVIDGVYYEIKGYNSEKYKTKVSQFPKELKLIILFKDDVKKYIDYTIQKYGQDYWKLLTDKDERKKI